MPDRSKIFVDTNIVIYSINSEDHKRDICRQLLIARPVISVQVLNESTNVMRRQLKFTWPEIEDALSGLRQVCHVVPVTETTHDLGLRMCKRYRISLYDAILLGAALENECTEFVSHDMQDGMTLFDTLTITNPFHVR